MSKTLSVNGTCYVLTSHAKERMWQRKISSTMIRDVIVSGKVKTTLHEIFIEFHILRLVLAYKGAVAVIITVMLIGVGGKHASI